MPKTMKTLEDYIVPTQQKLFDALRKKHDASVIFCKKNYVLVRGEAPVLLLAHLDTVHKEPVRDLCESPDGNILMSPQGIGGDDRCGVYAINTVYERATVKPWLLFTCDEEIGGVGASTFCDHHSKKKFPAELDEMKFLVEIDRKGANDAVYYSCENEEFEKYITSKGFETEYGSFSDISLVAPEIGVAAVNLSSGYYNAHMQHEYINRKELEATIERVLSIVADAVNPDTPVYEYTESTALDDGWGPYFDYYYGRGCLQGNKKKDAEIIAIEEDPYLKAIPAEIREAYATLMDFYTVEELEAIREENGDEFINILCEGEIGECYGVVEDSEEVL